jgi:hypothetical protein
MFRKAETEDEARPRVARTVEGQMLEPMESQKEIASVFDGIENQLDRSLAVQKDAIEKGLIEKLNREKEEAQKRIEAAEREFTEGKRILDGHRSALAELKSAKEQLQNQIKGHIDRALSCQQMMEKMSNQAYEEYDKVQHLSLELDGIRQRADNETSLLRKHLEEKYGVKAEFQSVFEPSVTLTEIRQQMLNMKKVRDMLAVSPGSVPPEEPAEAPAERPVAAPAERPVLRGHPEVRFTEPMEPQDMPEAEGLQADEEPTAEFDIAEDAEAEELRMMVERLAQYRKSEPVLNGTEFAYFQKGKKMILDGEAFLATLAKVSDVARGLHVNLGQKEMSKDLFLIKQEILNQQEILRKAFLRVVRFCEKEDGSLPQYVADILNVRIMKDILERLTFGNWSNPADFHAFVDHVASLRNAFKMKIAPTRDYLKSVLEQLEGGSLTLN